MPENPQRRLSDKIIAAHLQACEENNKEIAELLLRALEVHITALGGKDVVDHRVSMPEVNAAFERHEKMKAL